MADFNLKFQKGFDGIYKGSSELPREVLGCLRGVSTQIEKRVQNSVT